MAQDQTKKEALFNEVKGSLFEYLVARKMAINNEEELTFLNQLDGNYLTVLSQQDRMVRQFYPEMLTFLEDASSKATENLIHYLKETPSRPQLTGKLRSSAASDLFEADLQVETSKGKLPVSLKLNKKSAFVNTKSGGIKSFFLQYFPFLSAEIQHEFNLFVDQEFARMSCELHLQNDMEYPGDFSFWIKSGRSELPGELSPAESVLVKNFYARIAARMHEILEPALRKNPLLFQESMPALLGFSSPDILQVICFHEFKTQMPSVIQIHSYEDVARTLPTLAIADFGNIASVELSTSGWVLQLRVKPMNKFTTTAIKINCSVKFRQLSVS